MIDLGGNMFRSPVPAGGAVLNGAGECTGFLAAAEWGLVETPVFLTSTMQVGRVYDAACELLMAEDPGIGADDVIIPVVAECDDSFLSDARRMQVSADDVKAALDEARTGAGGAAPAEGAVGSGTGMSCLGFKGGIGPPAGSCITIVVTDGPLDSAACVRLARRAGLGLARTGSTGDHGSGEIFLALATGLRTPRGVAPTGPEPVTGRDLDPFFAAVVESTEEAVLNSMLAAPTVTGRDGNYSRGLPADRVRELLAVAGRI